MNGTNYEVPSSLWSLLHSPFTSLLGPNIRLRILFSNTLSLHSSLNLRDHASQPYSRTGNITVIYKLWTTVTAKNNLHRSMIPTHWFEITLYMKSTTLLQNHSIYKINCIDTESLYLKSITLLQNLYIKSITLLQNLYIKSIILLQNLYIKSIILLQNHSIYEINYIATESLYI